MKWIVFGFCVLVLYGCSLSAYEQSGTKNIENRIEEDATLQIVVTDEAFKKTLSTMWKATYPKHQDVLHIQVKPYTFSQRIEADITYVKDSDVMYKRQDAYNLSNMQLDLEYEIQKELKQNDRVNYFLPIEGKGLLFAYNEKTLTSRNGSIKDLTHMETMKRLKQAFYHNRKNDYVYPFLFQNYEVLQEEEISIDTIFQDQRFKANLEAYKQLHEDLSLRDGIFDRDSFYENNAFVSGLIDIHGDYKNSVAYKQGNLHFSSMPKYRNQKVSPIVDTYGFMVQKEIKYPNAVKAFLQMVRSKQGIQAILDETSLYPLLKTENIADFSIFDITKKEILAAMNDSQLRSTATFLERPAITFEHAYNKSDMLSLLQNYTYTNQSATDIQKEIIENVKNWLLRN